MADVPEALIDSAHVDVERLGHQALLQPDRFIVGALDPGGGKGADAASPYVYVMSDGHRSATVAERVVGGAAAFITVLAGILGQ